MGGEAVFVLKAFAKAAIFPPGCFLILFGVAGAAWAFGRRRFAAWTACLAALAAFLLATPPVSAGLTRLATAGIAHLPAHGALPPADAIVLLGGGVRYDAPEYGRDVIGRASMRRAYYAAALAKRTGLPVFVSAAGPRRAGGLGEAGTMRAFLDEVRASPRWVDSSPLDTDDSARAVRAALPKDQFNRILLVTSLIHMRRSVGLFRAQGFDVIPAPTGGGDATDRWWRLVLPTAGGYYAVAAAGNELLGRAAYAVSSWFAPQE